MSKPEGPVQSILFSGFIYKEEKVFDEVLDELKRDSGNPLDISEKINFEITEYYFKEMGKPLYRRFVLFDFILKDPMEIVKIKLKSYEIEKKYSEEGKRKINIDPGYLNNFQVVITTFKKFSHRIYIGEGVYAHLEYIFKKKKPEPLPWTYPDFLMESYLNIFKKWHDLYLKITKERKLNPNL